MSHRCEYPADQFLLILNNWADLLERAQLVGTAGEGEEACTLQRGSCGDVGKE